jgi:hypothetical protein
MGFLLATAMRARCGRAVAVLVVALTALTAPTATGLTKATAQASVVNHDATLRGDGTVPIKLHCAAAAGKRCKGNLLLVVKFNGANITNTKQVFVVGGRKSRTFHLQATNGQVELFVTGGVRDAIVKIKEKEPQLLPAHSALVTVHVPTGG